MQLGLNLRLASNLLVHSNSEVLLLAYGGNNVTICTVNFLRMQPVWPTSVWANKPFWTRSAAGPYGQKCTPLCLQHLFQLLFVFISARTGEAWQELCWFAQREGSPARAW